VGLHEYHEEATQVYSVSVGLWEILYVPALFISPCLYIAWDAHMTDDESVAQSISYLQELEEAMFLTYFHQIIEKDRQKSCHDRHVKSKTFLQ
jgi:hypothetical protein